MEPLRFQNGKPMLLAGLRRRHDTASAASSIAQQWREFLAAASPSNRVGTYYYGAMCGGDHASFEYLSGVEVESFAHLPSDTGRMRVPAQQYAVFRHPACESLGSTWQEIMAWLSRASYESAHLPDFERYETAPNDVSQDPNVEIWVGVVARGTRDPDAYL